MKRENRAGLELAIIFHLVVILVLLCAGISNISKNEQYFVLDFTKQEELERQMKEMEKMLEQEKTKAEVSKSVDEMIQRKMQESNVRNVAVNRNLKDDRHSSSEMKDLNSKAEQLQKELRDKASQSTAEQVEQAVSKTDNKPKGETPKSDIPIYKGRATVEYNLEGRSATRLSVPSYKCINGGEVTVIIIVNRKGIVIEAKVDEALSSSDRSMHEEAVKAAKASHFDVKNDAPERQRGTIQYIFIPQN